MALSKSFVLNMFQKRSAHLYAECAPKPSKYVVSILNMCCPLAHNVALLLKQNPLVRELRLYDDKHNSCGIAMDLSGIDTSTKVVSYTGIKLLKDCINGADVVVTLGGEPLTPIENYEQTFERNAEDVRRIALMLTEYNPNAIYCIAKHPVESMVPMVCQEYKRANINVADEKVIGIANYTSMIANNFIARSAKLNPLNVVCPIIGGLTSKTTVAVVSQALGNVSNPGVLAAVQKDIAFAEEQVRAVKFRENSGPFTVAPAVGIARLVTSVLKGLRGDNNCVECAYVKQMGHIQKFLPYMTAITRLGKYGVLSTHMPELNAQEVAVLKTAYPFLKQNIFIGESYVTGQIFPDIFEKEQGYCDVLQVKTVLDEKQYVPKPPKQIDQEEACKKQAYHSTKATL